MLFFIFGCKNISKIIILFYNRNLVKRVKLGQSLFEILKQDDETKVNLFALCSQVDIINYFNNLKEKKSKS